MSQPAGSRAHVTISGRVQGVGFRYSVQRQAASLGLRGWVRNLDSGDVEAVFEGAQPTLEAMVAWCREGPPGSWVRDVRVDWDEPYEALSGFEIRPTDYRGGLGARD